MEKLAIQGLHGKTASKGRVNGRRASEKKRKSGEELGPSWRKPFRTTSRMRTSMKFKEARHQQMADDQQAKSKVDDNKKN